MRTYTYSYGDNDEMESIDVKIDCLGISFLREKDAIAVAMLVFVTRSYYQCHETVLSYFCVLDW